MKKAFTLLLAGILTFSLAACGQPTAEPAAGDDSESDAQADALAAYDEILEEITVAYKNDTQDEGYAMYATNAEGTVAVFMTVVNGVKSIVGGPVTNISADTVAITDVVSDYALDLVASVRDGSLVLTTEDGASLVFEQMTDTSGFLAAFAA